MDASPATVVRSAKAECHVVHAQCSDWWLLLPFSTTCFTRSNGYTPLYEAGMSKKFSECVKILFKAGVVLDRDIYGNAAWSEGVVDEDGGTALNVGVWVGAPEYLCELLRRGANLKSVDSDGVNTLHAAAEDGDDTMLDILAKDGLRDLDVDAKDLDGRTAPDVFESRAG
ncbi:hypothetical protein NW762_008912 [Fusarium torreyae]|uniref:Ankyrin repeat protein n=1 Tax=Fusarium torreyae TaxID=1237075 RepID=A0A9W8VEW9_9HYPO|nr:hypothetical protein NW762_008912 [Fusarium torreyae]